MASIGKPLDRIDGKLKVSGLAQYAAEFNQPNMAYAVPVRATVAKGTITGMDTAAASKSGGVITILTHQNAQKLKAPDPEAMQKADTSLGEFLVPLQSNKVEYFGQLIGVVVAETYEQARSAAEMVKVRYAKEKPAVDLKVALQTAGRTQKSHRPGSPQVNEGKAAAPLAASAHRVEATYTTVVENHHPMEPHATIALWEGADKLTIYHTAQGVMRSKFALAFLFDLLPENVRVLSPYLGGGFGSKGNNWTQCHLAVMAAKAVARPVKLVITRQMMATTVGRRSATMQTVSLGADAQGKMTAIRHHTGTYQNLAAFLELTGAPTQTLYATPIKEITYNSARLTLCAPTFMRAPGYAPGCFALESAVDEMAYKLKMDPLQFRILNHTSFDTVEKLPFSAEYLLDCYRIGAEAFGWSRRKMEPRQNKQGRWWVGYGMASAVYHAHRSITAVRIRLTADGKVHVMTASQDLGTGTYTIVAQTAADALGLPFENVTVELGDSALPPAPLSAGSQTTSSVLPAVMLAGEQLRKDLMALAIADGKSDLKGQSVDAITYADGKLVLKSDVSKSDSYRSIMRRANRETIETCVTAVPVTDRKMGPSSPPCMVGEAPADANADAKKYAFNVFGAQFAEVWVDEELGVVKVKAITSVHDVGRIINEKTARSQVIGAVIYHIGQALMEETAFDPRYGNPATRSFADYHVPVQLDVPPIDVHFINKPDPHFAVTEAKGVGEIGGIGIPAAIANAIFNATGKRVRDLPLTLDKLMAG